MAKIPYSKFKIKIEEKEKDIEFNSIKIKIKQYLPINDKLKLISNVLIFAHEEENNFSNPVKENIYSNLQILFYYTNITFTDKQKENIPKLYDEVKFSGLLDLVLNNIPKEELDIIYQGIEKTVQALYSYQNSILGILDNLASTYKETEFDIETLQKAVAELQNSKLIKDIVPLLDLK